MNLIVTFVLIAAAIGFVFCSNYGNIIDGLLKWIITEILRQIKATDEITIIHLPATYNLSEIFPVAILAGTFALDKLTIYGLNSMQINDNTVFLNLTTPDYQKFCFHINITDEVGLKVTGYNADIGILDLLPIYGQGDIILELKDVHFDICAAYSESEGESKLSEFYVWPEFRASKLSISNFWNNSEMDDVLSPILTTIEMSLAMFVDYNIECLSCLLSEIIKLLISRQNINNYGFIDLIESADISCSSTCEWLTMQNISALLTDENAVNQLKETLTKNIFHYEKLANNYLKIYD